MIDTTIWIYLFEDHPRLARACERLVGEMGAGAFAGVVTPITLSELLVKPLRMGRPDVADRYRMALRTTVGLTLRPLDAEAGWVAGALRAKYGLPLPDMFQAAAAMREPAACLVTDDKDLRKVTEIQVILVDDLAGDGGRGDGK